MPTFFALIQEYKVTLGTIAVVIALFAYLTYSFVSPHGRFAGLHNDLKEIEPDGEHAYTDLDGNIVSMRDFRGKPLIINAWATWIPFSQTELKVLSDIAHEYGDAVTVLAINRMEHPSVIRSFLAAFSIENGVRILVDPTDHFYTATGGYAMPETLIFDAEGVLVEHTRGTFTESTLRERITSVLEE